MPESCLSLNEGKYEIKTKKGLKEFLANTIDTFYTILNDSNSNEDFKKKYAVHFNEEVKDFSKEISENRDDSLSDFAKTVKKKLPFQERNW